MASRSGTSSGPAGSIGRAATPLEEGKGSRPATRVSHVRALPGVDRRAPLSSHHEGADSHPADAATVDVSGGSGLKLCPVRFKPYQPVSGPRSWPQAWWAMANKGKGAAEGSVGPAHSFLPDEKERLDSRLALLTTSHDQVRACMCV